MLLSGFLEKKTNSNVSNATIQLVKKINVLVPTASVSGSNVTCNGKCRDYGDVGNASNPNKPGGDKTSVA